MKKQYIIFYNYYTKGKVGSGWIDDIEVIRGRGEKLDIKQLNTLVRKEIIKRNDDITNDVKIIITNIIDQNKI